MQSALTQRHPVILQTRVDAAEDVFRGTAAELLVIGDTATVIIGSRKVYIVTRGRQNTPTRARKGRTGRRTQSRSLRRRQQVATTWAEQ